MKSKNASLSDCKHLLICRHAKSSWSDATLSDFDRPLNKRGERDAPEMGRRLAERGIRPDLIMTSPAARALQTAHHYANQLACTPDRLLTNPLQYAATARQLITLLQETAPEVRTLLLVGHNPESTELANRLGGLNIDNIPTSGIVGLSFALSSWQELAPGTGKLLFFDYPKLQVPHS
jgi:phosphohistidine phosphatase